ncbi:hypothetical protein RB195_006578 [Necator americanus]
MREKTITFHCIGTRILVRQQATDMAAVRDDIPKEDQADKKPQDDEKPKIDPAKDENRVEANADKNGTGEKAEAKRTPVEGENEEKKKVKDKPKEKDVHVLGKNADGREKQRTIVFKVPSERKPVWSDIKIQNPTSDRKTFKVKCTSAEYFRVQPPFGFIKPMDTARIRVWFQNRNGVPTDGRRHYFAVYFMSAPDGKKTIKDLWHKNARQEGICRINAVFERIGDHSPEARSADCKTSKEPDK